MGASISPFALLHHTQGHRPVDPLHGPGLEIAHQLGLGLQGLGHHHEAGSILVQAVHDAGAGNGCRAGDVMQQGVEQGAFPIAGAWMGHQAGGLVDDQDGIVLVNDIQADVLRAERGLFRQGLRRHLHGFAAPDLLLSAGGRAGKPHMAGLDPALQAAAGILRQEFRQALIQAFPGMFGRNVEVSSLGH
jgi:hypothetical protein